MPTKPSPPTTDSQEKPDPEEEEGVAYWQIREQLRRLLIQDSLIHSHQNFSRYDENYPFVDPSLLRPGTPSTSKEHHLHHTALVVLLEDRLPDRLRRHFRCREGNRLTKANLTNVAPDLSVLETYRPQQRYSTDPEFDRLVQQLLPLDFSLLIQKSSDKERSVPVYELTNFHVKIERILDNALHAMGSYLSYHEVELYENGDAYVEQIEKKYFEFFNFYHSASGRRSAAILATQLLAQEGQRGTVFVTSQQDRRLTLFTTGAKEADGTLNIAIEHYTLLSLPSQTTEQLIRWGYSEGLDIVQDFAVACDSELGVFVFRTQFDHTPAAKPSPNGQRRFRINMRERWVRLTGEQIIPLEPGCSEAIHFPAVYQKEIDWEKMAKVRLQGMPPEA